jgi:hypothetical protein
MCLMIQNGHQVCVMVARALPVLFVMNLLTIETPDGCETVIRFQ